jgi:uncharacterized protein (DUF697 family)
MSVFESAYESPMGEYEVLPGELTGELHETQEMELATELLEIQSEEELEQFLGKLIGGAVKGIGNFARSTVGKSILGGLKGIAKTALPWVGGALGSFVAPGLGTVVGRQLGSMASRLFELELETMGEQEAEFEVARRIVRFGTAAARNAAAAPRTAPPRAVARAALTTAARRHAPGLVRGIPYGGPHGGPRLPRRPVPRGGVAYGYGPYADTYDGDGSGGGYDDGGGSGRAGRWVRRGRKIVLYGT